MSRLVVEFYREWVAFPHTRATGDDALCIGVHPNGLNEGGNYEFMVKDVGTQAQRRIAARVQLFSDSWQAFTDLPDFFAGLAALHDTQPKGYPTLDRIEQLCRALGWTDVTAKYAANHTHIYRCICGEHPEGS